MADKYYIQPFMTYRIIESESSVVVSVCTNPGEAELMKNALNEGAPHLTCEFGSHTVKIEGNLISCMNCPKVWQRQIKVW